MIVRLENVLFSANEGAIKTGAPFVTGAAVTAKMIAQSRSKKVLVFKYKSKSKYRRKRGHRRALH